MPKPTIILVPGAAHSPEIYSRVQERLHAREYPTVAVALPSAGADSPLPDRSRDVAAIRDSISQLVEQEQQEVVSVLHSEAGMPGSEAAKGLGKKERASQGIQGGVVRVVYAMAMAMTEGFQPSTDPAMFSEWMTVDLEDFVDASQRLIVGAS